MPEITGPPTRPTGSLEPDASSRLSRDGKPEQNLLWMAHCHIAEHAESAMMFSFNVARNPEPVR